MMPGITLDPSFGTTYYFAPQQMAGPSHPVGGQHLTYPGQQPQVYQPAAHLQQLGQYTYENGNGMQNPTLSGSIGINNTQGHSSYLAPARNGPSGKVAGSNAPAQATRSPRPVSNSMNGVRMTNFVFPSPIQTQQQKNAAATFPSSVPHSAASSVGSASGLSKLPPKPTFEPAMGRASAAASLDPNDRSGTFPFSTAILPMHAAGAQAKNGTSHPNVPISSASTAHKARSNLGVQLLERLPPLPSLPEALSMPPALQVLLKADGSDVEPLQDLQAAKVGRDESPGSIQAPQNPAHQTNTDDAQKTGALATDATKSQEFNKDAKMYVASLLRLIAAYRERERGLQLRIEALAFQPAQSWNAVEEAEAKKCAGILPSVVAENGLENSDVTLNAKTNGSMDAPETNQPINAGVFSADNTATAGEQRPGAIASKVAPPASVLGVRLLRKVIDLQTENDELGRLLEEKLKVTDNDVDARPTFERSARLAEDAEQQRPELQDAHMLLASLSAHLEAAETRAQRAEAALDMAVRAKSTAVLAEPANLKQGLNSRQERKQKRGQASTASLRLNDLGL